MNTALTKPIAAMVLFVACTILFTAVSAHLPQWRGLREARTAHAAAPRVGSTAHPGHEPDSGYGGGADCAYACCVGGAEAAPSGYSCPHPRHRPNSVRPDER